MTRPRTSNSVQNIGPYELVEKVGSGGMGAVYRSRDSRDGRIVALKLMHEHVASDPSYAERFRREAAVAALIDSPHVVRVLEFATDGGRPYIVTEFIDGPSVEELLKHGPLASQRAAAIAAGVAQALHEGGRRGVVHRDIKPANILITPGGVAKVTDFGIATLNHSSSLTMPGMFVGTAAYAAPEQHNGETDIRSDIYSLGVVLFEMLTGTLPFEAETATGMMRKHEEASPPMERLSGQPSCLVDAVARCLEKAPGRRFQAPEELVAALGAGAGAPVVPDQTTIVSAQADVTRAGDFVAAPAAAAAVTSIELGENLTGEQLQPAPLVLAAWQRKLSEIPLLRKAVGAGVIVAVITAGAMLSFRGSAAENGTPYSGGGGSERLIGTGIETATPGATATATPPPSSTPTAPPSSTATRPPKTPPTSAPVLPTVTPEPVLPTAAPTKPTAVPTATPAPALYLADYAFCHLALCPYGNDDLYAGYAIGVTFQLSGVTSKQVVAEIWFEGAYYYTSTFTASANGFYYDLLPYANYAGELQLDVYAGGVYLGSMNAWVS